MEYYFTAQKMAVGYDNRPLIENIDFSLKRGEILTLIGPNGAGKSTILKSIARQLSLVSGTIYLDKSDVVTMNGNEFAKKMAVVLTDKLKTELMWFQPADIHTQAGSEYFRMRTKRLWMRRWSWSMYHR